MNERITSLVTTLSRRQRADAQTDAQFAARLGLSRPMWGMLRRGKTRPGRKSLERIVRAFPEYQVQVAALFLPSDLPIGNEEVDNVPDGKAVSA